MTDISLSTVVEKLGDSLMSVMFKKCADFTMSPIKKSFHYNCKMIFFPALKVLCIFAKIADLGRNHHELSSTSDFPLMQQCLK